MKIGIYYFSGTGNTEFIAKEIKNFALTQNNAAEVSLYPLETSPIFDEDIDLLIIGGPIYAGNMPEKLIRYVLRNISKNKNQTKAIVYSTSTGLANAFGVDSIASKLSKKNYEILHKERFEMPRNFYFGSYESQSQDEIHKRIENSKEKVSRIFDLLNQENFKQIKGIEISNKGILGKDLLEEVFSIISRFMGKSYKATDTCILCKKCINSCPQKNIQLKNGKIHFKSNCMMCTRCIHICPVNAITYKNVSYPQYNHFLKEKA